MATQEKRTRVEVPRKVPILDDAVKKECDKDGVYTIKLPELENSKLIIDGEPVCNTILLRCQSLHVRQPDTICKCNSVVKTIVGGGTGDQCEIIECGKCRTAYLVRTIYDKEGHLKLNVSVWDTGRNLRPFAKRTHDDDYNFKMKFNK